MKKALSLILALVLCLSLCACGGNAGDEPQKQTEESKEALSSEDFIGSWECEYTSDVDNSFVSLGDSITARIEIYEAGIAKIIATNTTKEKEHENYSATWEIKDDCYIRITFTAAVEVTRAYKIDVSGAVYTLTQIDKPERVYYKK